MQYINELLNSIENDLVKVESIVVNKEDDLFKKGQEQYVGFLNMILFLIIIGFPISIFLTLNMEKGIFFGLYMLISIVFISYIYFNRYKRYNNIGQKTKDIILAHFKIHEKLVTCIGRINGIDEIMENMSDIQKIIGNHLSLGKNSTSTIFKELTKKEFLFCVILLKDLRSDLSVRLTEQQSLLESAKGEVSENIKGTTELNQVSELQKVRLDKQIEQFEELQRVLVKV